MKPARLAVRLFGIGEARAEGLGALMVTALAMLALILMTYASDWELVELLSEGITGEARERALELIAMHEEDLQHCRDVEKRTGRLAAIEEQGAICDRVEAIIARLEDFGGPISLPSRCARRS